MRRVIDWLPILLLAGCARGHATFLDPYGPVAAAQRRWLFDITLTMLVVMLPVFVLLPAFAWRYRRRGKGAYRPNWEFSWPLEFLVWGVPTVVVGVLAWMIITWEAPRGPYRPVAGAGQPLVIDVVALDWKFLFLYPAQRIATVGEVALPQGRPVRFRLTSDATMQSFWVPSLGSQVYAMAGMVTALNLVADRTGTLLGKNTQFNGMKFQDDKFRVLVLPPGVFAAWVAAQGKAPRVLDAESYAEIAKHGTTTEARETLSIPPDEPFAFHASPDLFRAIVAKYHPGGSMPMPEEADAHG